ncbi:hypothetical protein RJ639_044656 [Escallonia herrerae]|uniref:Uncharacterized protein n=1 Tax=Escallonia herrerae TaxID=1293975 RepID=A0AA88WCT3_9ASTE|nr:hypothetical protein RJ639_044656 [Escallonia herrerae]
MEVFAREAPGHRIPTVAATESQSVLYHLSRTQHQGTSFHAQNHRPRRKAPSGSPLPRWSLLCRITLQRHYPKLLTSFVSLARVIVVPFDYRLAPENPLPIPYEDSWASMQWVAAHFGGEGDLNRGAIPSLSPRSPTYTTSNVDMLGANYQLTKLLGLRSSVKRLMIYQQGCFAGGTVLRLAKDLAKNNAWCLRPRRLQCRPFWIFFFQLFQLKEAFAPIGISDWNSLFWITHPGGPRDSGPGGGRGRT